MNTEKIRQIQFHTFSTLLGMLFLLVGCSSQPSASDAERAIRSQIKDQSEGRIKLVSFKKTNGQGADFMGVPSYRMEYEGEIEFSDDCKWIVDSMWLNGSFCTIAPSAFNMSYSQTLMRKGQRQKLKGSVTFEKTEKGWRATEERASALGPASPSSAPQQASASPTSTAPPNPQRVLPNSLALVQEIQKFSQLVMIKYVLQQPVGHEKPAESALGKMFSGQNRVVVLVQGVVKAGVDLQNIQPGALTVENTKVSLTLPPAQITDVYLDDQKTEVLESSTGLFRPFTSQLDQAIRVRAVENLRQAARNNGILKEADDRAREQLKRTFELLGFKEVEFRVP